MITPETIVVFQLEIPIDTILYAIDVCREKGAYIILNGAPAAAIPEDTLKKLDLFIVNDLVSADLAKQIEGARFIPTFEELEAALRETAEPGDIILTVGAGDVYQIGEHLTAE